MKTKLVTALMGMLASGMLLAIGTQAADGGQAGQQEQRQQQGQQQYSQGQLDLRQANNLNGLPVLNENGQKIGQVDNVLVDMDQGRLAFAIVSSGGGIFGATNTKYIVPWQAIRTIPQGAGAQQPALLVHVASLNQLRPAPLSGNVQGSLDRQSGREIFQYYGLAPYWEEQMPRQQAPQPMQQRGR